MCRLCRTYGGVDNIQISGGNITVTTDSVVGEYNHVDGCAAGIGCGEKRNLDGAVIPITDALQIEAYAVGTTNEIEESSSKKK